MRAFSRIEGNSTGTDANTIAVSGTNVGRLAWSVLADGRYPVGIENAAGDVWGIGLADKVGNTLTMLGWLLSHNGLNTAPTLGTGTKKVYLVSAAEFAAVCEVQTLAEAPSATGDSAQAWGRQAVASAPQAIALGFGAVAAGGDGIAIGSFGTGNLLTRVDANAQGSLAMLGGRIFRKNGVAIGRGARNHTDGAVMLASSDNVGGDGDTIFKQQMLGCWQATTPSNAAIAFKAKSTDNATMRFRPVATGQPECTISAFRARVLAVQDNDFTQVLHMVSDITVIAKNNGALMLGSQTWTDVFRAAGMTGVTVNVVAGGGGTDPNLTFNAVGLAGNPIEWLLSVEGGQIYR